MKDNLTRRCHVKAWFPPQRMMEIATERTEGLVCAFIARGHRNVQATSLPPQVQSMLMLANELGRPGLELFARSCYLQGLNDAIDAAARMEYLREEG